MKSLNCFLKNSSTFFLAITLCLPLKAAEWPDPLAKKIISIYKVDGDEMNDPIWMHLHQGHPTAKEDLRVTLGVQMYDGAAWNVIAPESVGFQMYYTIRDIPVSGLLSAPFTFDLSIDNPALDGLEDGFHDISVVLVGDTTINDYKPTRAFLHITRGRPLSDTVPIIQTDSNDGAGVVYVNRADRRAISYPLNPNVEPWIDPPHEADLFQEKLMPHTPLFKGAQLWWEDPPHPGKPFIRSIGPKHGNDDVRGNKAKEHEKLPFKDGPRGIGWMSNFVGGQVDSQGRLLFAETGGRVGMLLPDGEIITVAGWRVKPDKDPVWGTKPLSTVRKNMELKGNWIEGNIGGDLAGFHLPLDVTPDPRDPNIWYVAAFEDHCIWKIELNDSRGTNATVSVFAGDPDHSKGFTDGLRHAARFNGPTSVIFDPVRDVMYVTDQDNDAIRQITRNGVVSTLFGTPGVAQKLKDQGLDYHNHLSNRAHTQFTVSAIEATNNVKPEIYAPQCVRVFSNGDIGVLDYGFGSIRRINPVTGETRLWANLFQKFHYDFDRGWAWMDIDRWGNSGPKDGTYWCMSVGDRVDGDPDGSRFNEVYAWVGPEGGLSKFVFDRGLLSYPMGWGYRSATRPPHYPWLVAVDPRGGVYLAGLGDHGVTRLRKKRAEDQVPIQDYLMSYYGEEIWNNGFGKASPSFTQKFGWGTQNYLGLASTWDLTPTKTDQELMDYFEVPTVLRSNADAISSWLYYVRGNILNNSLGSPDNSPPTIPENFTFLQAGSRSLIFSWTPSTDNVGLVGYRIEVSNNSNFSNPIVVSVGNETSFGVTGLESSTRYFARVRAVDTSANSSGNSNMVEGETLEAGIDGKIFASAGSDKFGAPNTSIPLDGTIFFDGSVSLPPLLGSTWEVISGPSGVTIENRNLVDTTVRVSSLGTYIFRLTVRNLDNVVFDDVKITVTQGGGASSHSGALRTMAEPGKPAIYPQCVSGHLYNQLGAKVSDLNFIAGVGVEIKSDDLAPGLYFVQCDQEFGGHYNGKLVVLK
ncbi:MAG: fibronectin type III domain-containing protein [Elusimicrobiota bacterium]